MAENTERKGGFGKLLLVIIILAAIAALIWFLLGGDGFSLFDSGSGSSEAGDGTDRAVVQQDDVAGQTLETMDISVNGDTYVIGGTPCDLDAALASAESRGSVKVIIHDNSAVEDTMNALTSGLSGKGISYEIVSSAPAENAEENAQ